MEKGRVLGGVAAVLAAVALAACGVAPSPSASTPSASPPSASPPSASPPSASPPSAPAPSPVLITHTSVTCLPERRPLPSALQGDPCPSAVAAINAVIAPIGLTAARIYIEPGPFDCGDLWPGVGSPPVCFGPFIAPGTQMHGWVSFIGSDKVAAVALSRSVSGSTATPWRATVHGFEVPPAGWVMP